MLNHRFTSASTMAFVAACVVGHALPLSGRDFAVRQVTSFGDPTTGSRATPLGVINDRLLFVAIENGVPGLYRTDGLNIELIDNSAQIHVDEVAQIDELFFAGTGLKGRELYASDGQSLRQVADLAPGSLNANPRNFNVLNGHLVFTGITSDASLPGGAPIRFFHTDGDAVEEFPFAPFSPSRSVKLGDRLVFGGIPPGGGQLMLRATDGGSIFDITTPHGNMLSQPPLTKVGDHAYFVAGDGVERGVYRTDGAVAERIAAFDSFTHLDQVQYTFDNQGDFIFTMHDRTADELIFYRTGGESVTEVTRWAIPSGINLPHSLADPQPEFSDSSRAFFEFQHFQNGLVHEIYVFDGSSFGLFLSNPNKKFSFKEVNGRVFINESSANPTLYELVDGSLVPIGTALDAMFEFQGEIFGWNGSIPSVFSAATLWEIQSGSLKSLGDVVSQFAQPTGPFVEFRGELYFAGQMGGFPSEIRDHQLYAIFAVPEPTSSAVALVALTTLVLVRGRPNRFGHER